MASTVIAKVSGTAGFQFTLVEFDVTTNWINLDTQGTFTLHVDQPVAAITLAPDSDVDQALVAFPNILLGNTGSPPQQTMVLGVGSPIVGRINALGAVINGTIDISPASFNYVLTGAIAFFSGAAVDPRFPKLKLQIWWEYPPTLPIRRFDFSNTGQQVTLTGGTDVIYREPTWGRKHMFASVTGDNTVLMKVNGITFRNNGANQERVELASVAIASNQAILGPFDYKPFDCYEVTAAGALGQHIIPTFHAMD